MTLFLIILATVLVGLISLIGIMLLGLKEKTLRIITPVLVSFAAGTMLGDAFIHLLPESVEKTGTVSLFYALCGIVIFFAVEKLLNWHHCRGTICEKPTAYVNLLGDGIHNFMDGIIIATSFMADLKLGIATTVAIILHEIPQEIGDFGILIKSGMKREKAIFYNFIIALTAVAGAISSFFFLSTLSGLASILLPVAAGGLIYIAASDLLPELHKETRIRTSLIQIILLLSGIGIMYYLKVTGL